MAGGKAAYGTVIAAGNGASSEVFTAIAYVTGINGVKPTNNTADTTCLSSTGGWMEHITTTRDPGTVDIDLNFEADNATHMGLFITKFAAGSINNYRITFTDVGVTTCTFAASVESYSINSQVADKATLSVTFKIDGPLTWA